MVKPIYCNLLLIFLCLIYEAYGSRPYNDSLSSSTTVNDAKEKTAAQTSPCLRRKSFNSNNALGYDKNRGSVQVNRSTNNIHPYNDSLSSSTTVNDAEENPAILELAAQSPSPRHRRKSFSSNNGVGYDKNRGSVQNNRSTNNIHPYNDSLSSSTTVNDAVENPATLESAAQSPSPRHRRKSFSSNNGVGYDRNRRSVQNNKPSNYFGPYDLSSSSNTANVAGDNSAAQSSSPRLLRKSLISNNGVGYDKNRGSVQNNRSNNNIHPYNDLLSSSTTVNDAEENPATLESAEQSPSSCHRSKSFNSTDGLRYDRNHRTVQDNKNQSKMNKRMPSPPPHPLRNNFRKSMRNTKQPMFVTTSYGDNDFIMPKIMNGKLKPIRLSSFNRFGNSFNEDNDTQETENQKNMRLGSTRYSTVFPSFSSSNGEPGMGSEKIKQNYPYSEPIGVSADEANKIRNDVLQKSNFYRNKFKLIPFTLDDQLNNCAQDWANIMAKQQLFNHRPKNVYGENLYGNQDLKNLGETAVDSWYNEMSIFTIGNEENFDTLHMTQLLWKKSTKLGVGVSQNPESGMYYVVANYDPKGNLLDHFQKNLPDITEEDIEEAKEADKRLKAKLEKPVVTSWSSGSSIPFGSGWRNYGSYFN